MAVHTVQVIDVEGLVVDDVATNLAPAVPFYGAGVQIVDGVGLSSPSPHAKVVLAITLPLRVVPNEVLVLLVAVTGTLPTVVPPTTVLYAGVTGRPLVLDVPTTPVLASVL